MQSTDTAVSHKCLPPAADLPPAPDRTFALLRDSVVIVARGTVGGEKFVPARVGADRVDALLIRRATRVQTHLTLVYVCNEQNKTLFGHCVCTQWKRRPLWIGKFTQVGETRATTEFPYETL